MTNPQLETLNSALPHLVPRAAEMGVRFVELRPGYVCARLPFEGNGNHVGTVYAGVIFTLAELLGGAMHLATFDATTHYPLVRSMTIDFLSPGRGPLTASAALPDDVIATTRAAVAGGNKAAMPLAATVVSDDGVVVARTHGDYQLRPYDT
ncbi:MAG: hypothetical protein QOE97_1922 [Pseudonocardiales bacterium]|nr:hypothetical protein [Pseudonocardiales bacterium]